MLNTFLQDALPPEEMNLAKEHCRSADLVLCLGTRYQPYYSLVIVGIVLACSVAEISILTNFFDLQIHIVYVKVKYARKHTYLCIEKIIVLANKKFWKGN